MVKTIDVSVRGTQFKLMGYTRSLELCARMNYETENLDFIDQMDSSEVLYDLGSCEGRFSIYAAKKGISVFAFEPELRNFKVLEENLQVNELEGKVRTFKKAIGERNHIGILKIGQPWEGGHQKIVQHPDIREDLQFNYVDEEVIEIISLDDFRERNHLPSPNCIKIDIDGSEIPFMKGSVKTLGSPSLRALIYELDKADKNYIWIVENLKSIGFVIVSEFNVPNEANLFNIVFRRES